MFPPNFVGFLVLLVDRNEEFLLRQFEIFGDKLPRELYRFLFKVVAEGEVSQHFKEGVVAGGIAHLFQVVVFSAYPQTFLAGGCPRSGGFLFTQKILFKGNHPRVYKEQGRVVLGNEGKGFKPLVFFLFKV